MFIASRYLPKQINIKIIFHSCYLFTETFTNILWGTKCSENKDLNDLGHCRWMVNLSRYLLRVKMKETRAISLIVVSVPIWLLWTVNDHWDKLELMRRRESITGILLRKSEDILQMCEVKWNWVQKHPPEVFYEKSYS